MNRYQRYERYERFELEELGDLEQVERRFRYVPEERTMDLDELDDVDFKARYRLEKETVEEIIKVLKPQLDSATTQNRALLAEEKVLLALRFFAFGDYQINLGDMQKISQPACCKAINEVATSLAELSSTYIFLPQTEQERKKVSNDFENRCGIPNVLGALDCTLIKIISPGGDNAERFRSRKGTFALNVQTLGDVDLSIRNLVVRWPGSAHDSTIFDHSYLRAHLQVDLQEKYLVLGDSGYPLRSYLLTPFLNPANIHQRRYNTAQILGRNVVERKYGVWKRRFRCIDSKLRCRLDNAQNIIIATAVLHNIAVGRGDYYDVDDYEDDDDDFVNYDQTNGGVSRRNAIVAARFTF